MHGTTFPLTFLTCTPSLVHPAMITTDIVMSFKGVERLVAVYLFKHSVNELLFKKYLTNFNVDSYDALLNSC